VKKVDLHTHSTASDGLLTPTQLLNHASQLGLYAISLTDHDTINGMAEALKAGQETGVKVIPGVEISADFSPGTMHIVGLGLDPANRALRAKLEFLQQARRDRNPKIIRQLNAAGVEITFEEVQAEAKGGQIGRPHFAAVILRKGLAKNWDDVFDTWLGKGKPGYVDKERFSSKDAVDVIHASGGKAIIAHPVQLQLPDKELEACMDRLVREGIDGIEVYHSDHGRKEEEFYLSLAKRHGLKISGGSDYHGFKDKPVELGIPEVDVKILEDLGLSV
jgi:predicted metal-dependent phosphoesterase TrpH